jgi:hypothetical protein
MGALRALLLTAVLLLVAAEQTRDAAAGRDEECSTALRNQEASRANLRVDLVVEELRAMRADSKADMKNLSADLRSSFNSWTEGPVVKLIYIMSVMAAAALSFILRYPAKFGAMWAVLVSASPVGVAPPIPAPAAQVQAGEGQDLHFG